MYAGTHESYELFVHKYLITLLIASDDRQPRNETLGLCEVKILYRGEDIHTYVCIRINYIFILRRCCAMFLFRQIKWHYFSALWEFHSRRYRFCGFHRNCNDLSSSQYQFMDIYDLLYISQRCFFLPISYIHTCVGGVTMTSLLRNKLAFVSYRAII